MSPVTPQKPPDTRPPTQPKTPPPSTPKKVIGQLAAVRRLTMGASLVLRQVDPLAPGWSQDGQRLADRIEIAASRLRDARAALDAAHAMAQWIADCQLLDQVDAIRADLQTPARQGLLPRCAAEGSPSRVAAPGGPVSSGRGGQVPGSEPVRPGRFSLPLRPAVPRFDAELLGTGVLYDSLPTQVCGVADYGSFR